MNIPEGWKLVPVKETHEMRAAFREAEKGALISGLDHIEAFFCGYKAMLEAAPEPEISETPPRKIIRKGDVFKSTPYGWVQFKGFDYYMGQKTAMLYSSESRDTYYPFPERIEQTDNVEFVDL